MARIVIVSLLVTLLLCAVSIAMPIENGVEGSIEETEMDSVMPGSEGELDLDIKPVERGYYPGFYAGLTPNRAQIVFFCRLPAWHPYKKQLYYQFKSYWATHPCGRSFALSYRNRYGHPHFF